MVSKYNKYVGKTLGKWTALKLLKPDSKGRRKMFCRCECGEEKEVECWSLVNRPQKGCYKCSRKHTGFNKKPKHNLIGKKFGLLTVIDHVKKSVNKKSKAKNEWFSVCRCECGVETIVNSSNLIRRQVKSCGCLRSKRFIENPSYQGYEQISKTYWSRIKLHAKERNIEFCLLMKDAWGKILEQNFKCALSGEVLIFDSAKSSNQTASLDRIDSNKSYNLNNIQWVHKDINKMKCQHSQDKFIDICKKIASYNQ